MLHISCIRIVSEAVSLDKISCDHRTILELVAKGTTGFFNNPQKDFLHCGYALERKGMVVLLKSKTKEPDNILEQVLDTLFITILMIGEFLIL
jgi:hypothetical protein